VDFVRPDPAAGESLAVLVAAPEVVLSGTQVSFGYKENDARLAFQRLARSLEQGGTSLRKVVFAHYYPLSPGIASQVHKIRAEFLPADKPPASTMVTVEGLPAIDAGFAVDVVAVKQ
jgi:enamine deaminase RidA (YjgF/YER057c/UK114 family)